EDGERLRCERELTVDGGEQYQCESDVPPRDRALRGVVLAAQREDQRGEEDTGEERHSVSRHAARFEAADEEERHPADRENSGGDVASAHCLAEDQRREEEHPDDAG